MNKHCIYNNKYKRELFYSQKAQESRLRTVEANENEIINNQIPLTKKIKYYLKKYKYPIIIGGVIILVGINYTNPFVGMNKVKKKTINTTNTTN